METLILRYRRREQECSLDQEVSFEVRGGEDALPKPTTSANIQEASSYFSKELPRPNQEVLSEAAERYGRPTCH